MEGVVRMLGREESRCDGVWPTDLAGIQSLVQLRSRKKKRNREEKQK